MEVKEFIDHFVAQFDDDPGQVEATTNFRDIDGWSSLVALSVIAMADEEYSVKLTGEEIRTSNTVSDLFEKIKAKKG